MMTRHTIGHSLIPPGPWTMDRWAHILYIWSDWLSNGQEAHNMDNAPRSHIRLWFEDVALGDDWVLLGEVMSPLFTLDDELYTLDVEHFKDDVTHMMIMMMVGPTPSLGYPWLMILGTWHGSLEDVLMLSPRTLCTLCRTWHVWCKALGHMMTWHI